MNVHKNKKMLGTILKGPEDSVTFKSTCEVKFLAISANDFYQNLHCTRCIYPIGLKIGE